MVRVRLVQLKIFKANAMILPLATIYEHVR